MDSEKRNGDLIQKLVWEKEHFGLQKDLGETRAKLQQAEASFTTANTTSNNNNNNKTSTSNSSSSSAPLPSHPELQAHIARLQASCAELEEELVDLRKQREDADEAFSTQRLQHGHEIEALRSQLTHQTQQWEVDQREVALQVGQDRQEERVRFFLLISLHERSRTHIHTRTHTHTQVRQNSEHAQNAAEAQEKIDLLQEKIELHAQQHIDTNQVQQRL